MASQDGPCYMVLDSQSVCYISVPIFCSRKNLCSTERVNWFRGTTSLLVDWVPENLLQGLNHPGRAADTSPSVEVQNAWCYATSSPHLHAVDWGQIWHHASSLKSCMLFLFPFSFISVSRLFWLSGISLS